MPAAWDRLADATQGGGAKRPLSVITLGDVSTETLHPLTPHFASLEQLVLDIAPRDPLAAHRAELNRAIDAASSDWVLIVRERETIDDSFAAEIAARTSAGGARAFRARSVPHYAGRPLRIRPDEGEVRLFHRRYYMRYANKGEWTEISVQGTVVRLEHPLRSITFESPEAHTSYLAAHASPRSLLRRMFVFLGYLLATRVRDANSLRYLWIEAGFQTQPE